MMETPVEQLRDYLFARHECLSGHELALAHSRSEKQGVHLLAVVLQGQALQPGEMCEVLGSPNNGSTIELILERALQDRSLDSVVQQLDAAFDLAIEAPAPMAP